MHNKILQKAAQTGDLKTVKKLLFLERKKSPDFVPNDDTRWNHAFLLACNNGHHGVVSLLLRHGLDVNSCDDDQKTALMYACENGNDAVVRLLVKSKGHGQIDLDLSDGDGKTALMISCQGGHLSTVKLLTSYVLNLDARDNEGRTALMYGCQYFRIHSHLISRNAHLDACDNRGKTALMCACLCGHLRSVLALIDNDAFVDAEDDSGNSALIYATKYGHYHIVRALTLSGKADCNIQGAEGKTALIHAVLVESMGIVRALMDCDARSSIHQDRYSRTALVYACDNNLVEIADYLIELANDIDETYEDNFWYDALVSCCVNGRDEIVKLFIKHGINLDHFHDNEHPKQPLMIACEKGQSDVVRVMVNHGVRTDDYESSGRVVFINAHNLQFETALMFACRKGHYDIVNILTTFAVNARMQDAVGNTALMLACEIGNIDIVNHLLSLPLDVHIDAKGAYSLTAITDACYRGHVKIVELLLLHGANVNLVDDQDMNGMMYACKEGYDEIVRLLLKSDINIDQLSHYGASAFLYACDCGHINIAQLLLDHYPSIDVDFRGMEQETALICAAAEGHDKVVDFLLKRNADIHAIDSVGFTPFKYACYKGFENTASLMLKYDGDVGKTGLDVAIEMGQVHIVSLLIRSGVDLNYNHEANYTCNKTVLNFACEFGIEELVGVLMKCDDVDVNVGDIDNKTALIHACENGYYGIVSQLMRKSSVDVNARDISKKTALIHACENGFDEIVALLVSTNNIGDINAQDWDKKSALIHACEKGFEKVVRLLVCMENLDFNLLDDDCKTALIYASQNGFDKIVSVLMKEENVNIDLLDDDDRPALSYACEEGHEEVARILISHDAAFHVGSPHKQCLMYAYEKGHKRIVDLIMKKYCDVNCATYEWKYALLDACRVGYERVVRNLVVKKAGVRVNANFFMEDECLSPLMIASQRGHLNIVRVIVKHCECDINFCGVYEDTALMYACQQGHGDVVDFLIATGADVSAKDCNGKTALMHAWGGRHDDIVGTVLRPGDDVHLLTVDTEDETALMYACRKGSEKLVDALLKFPVNVDGEDLHGKTALVRACERGYATNVSIVKRLLMQGDIDVNAKDDDGKTALMYACQKGCERLVVLLASHGADGNVKDGGKKSALMYLCDKGYDQHRIVDCLIRGAKNVDVDAQDQIGRTALMYAIEKGNKVTAKILIRSKIHLDLRDFSQKTALMYASERGCSDIVSLLKKRGADLNVSDRLGRTALMFSCQNGHGNVVKLLLRYNGINVNAVDNVGRNALVLACQAGWGKVVNQLVSNELVDAGLRDILLRTPLICACDRGHSNVVEVLLNRGIDIEAKDNFGNTALFYACSKGYFSIVKQLVKVRSQTMLLNLSPSVFGREWGQEPILHACLSGYDHIVDALIREGVSCNTRHVSGKSLLMIACEKGRLQVVKALVKHDKINLDFHDKEGLTALMYACIYGREQIVELLLNYHADEDARDHQGTTALIHACDGWGTSSASTNIVKHLLRHGADVNIENNLGHSAFWYSCPYWQMDILIWLMRRDLRNEMVKRNNLNVDMPEAIEDGLKLDIVYLLIRYGLSVDAVPKCGITALMFTASFWMPNVEVSMSKFLARDADVDKVDDQGCTVFSHALTGTGETMRFLLESGRLSNDDGSLKAIHLKKVIENTEVDTNALLLVMREGIFNWDWCPNDAVSQIGLTALEMGFCPRLIHYGSDDGYTSPIMHACMEGNVEAFKMFFSNRYFFPEDYVALCNSNSLRNNDEIETMVKSQPVSLESLSVLRVSVAIAQTGLATRRAERVEALPIPELMKRMLKFENCDKEYLRTLQNEKLFPNRFNLRFR